MRRTLAAIIALLLIGAAAWTMVKSQRTYAYPYTKVTEEVTRIASSTGATIIDQRTVSAALRARASKAGTLDSLSRKISGRPLVDDLVEYTLQDGPDTVRLSIYHALGKVELVKLRSGGSSSKLAAALASGMKASFPKLDCHLERP